MLKVTSSKDVITYLIRDANMLNEVTVFGQTKKQELDAIKRDYRNKGSFYGGKPPLLSFIFSPLTYFNFLVLSLTTKVVSNLYSFV